MTDQQETSEPKKHRIFEDISLVQVTATALAAVTSMLLSTYIGIAGSVIGVAVASIVSTTAASLYKHFLNESAEKIKEIPAINKTQSLFEHEQTHNDSTDVCKHPHADNTDTDTLIDIAKADHAAIIPAGHSGVVASSTNAAIPHSGNASDIDHSEKSQESTAQGDTLTQHDSNIVKLEISHKRLKIGLIIVCVVSALLTVALSAGIVYTASAGKGLGTKPHMIVVASPDEGAHDGDRQKNATPQESSSNSSVVESSSDSSSHANESSSADASLSSSDQSSAESSSSQSSSGTDAPGEPSGSSSSSSSEATENTSPQG